MTPAAAACGNVGQPDMYSMSSFSDCFSPGTLHELEFESTSLCKSFIHSLNCHQYLDQSDVDITTTGIFQGQPDGYWILQWTSDLLQMTSLRHGNLLLHIVHTLIHHC